MNPRTLCREGGYDSAICVTYSFDPIFFERVVLHDLWAGGATDVLVIADANQAAEAMGKMAGQLSYLGRRYQLAMVGDFGAQHAKLILKLGRNGGLIWVGSNNLTAPAWNGNNRELASAWQVEPRDALGAATIRSILSSFSHTLSVSARKMIERSLERDWLSDTGAVSAELPVLVSGPGGTLAAQLAARWSGREFRTARIITGSTDESGAMLKWLATTFGVRAATVALDPARSAFQPAKLRKLPLSVRVVPLDSHPIPHAKFLWLTGKRGSAAIVGSANCSAAGWLLRGNDGGNIESIAVFDECEEDSFRTCLDVCSDEAGVPPEDVPGLGKAQQSYGAAKQDAIRLLELSCNAQVGELRATVAAPISSAALVELEISGIRMALRCGDPDGLVWLGPMPDITTGWTHFARLVVHYTPKRTEYSGLMWLNEEDELQHSIGGRQLSNAIGNLSRPPATTSEQQKLLQELAQLASALFSDRHAFPDPVIARANLPADKRGQPRRAVDPDELVRSIAELDEHQPSSNTPAGGLGLPVVGVMRVLFPPIEQPDEAELGEESDEEKQQQVGEEKRHKRTPTPPYEAPPDRFRNRLVAQVDEFVRRLGEPEFAERCTATQLVQAAAFPLAVALKALDGRWIDGATADSWTFKVADVLFRVGRAKKTELAGGLLAVVRERYELERRAEVFEEVVGDGRLWLVLSAALHRAGPKQSGGLERALALADVFHEPLLWNSADSPRIGLLLSRMQGGSDRKEVLMAARKTAHIVRDIEAHLGANAAQYADRQHDDWHAAGDALWKHGIGFGRAEEASPIQNGARLKVYLRRRGKAVTVVPTYYVNLRIAAERDGRLLQLLNEVAPCWLGHKPSTTVRKLPLRC